MWYVILNRNTLMYFITQYPNIFIDNRDYYIYESPMSEKSAEQFAQRLNTLEISWES